MAPPSGIRVRLPAVFRADAGGRAEVRVQATTVGEALAALCREAPALAGRLLGPDGRPRRYVSLFVNDEDARLLGGVDAAVKDGDSLTIVPAISGGAPVVDAAVEEALLPPLATVAALAEASPAAEVCGFVLGGLRGEPPVVVPVGNVAGDPARAFAMAPADVLLVLRTAEAEGRRIAALYHSHVTSGACLSAVDVAELTAGGQPLLPGAELWVAGLERGEAVEVRGYGWTEAGYAERFRRPGPFTRRESVRPEREP